VRTAWKTANSSAVGLQLYKRRTVVTGGRFENWGEMLAKGGQLLARKAGMELRGNR
jgi:hypothetical protein